MSNVVRRSLVCAAFGALLTLMFLLLERKYDRAVSVPATVSERSSSGGPTIRRQQGRISERSGAESAAIATLDSNGGDVPSETQPPGQVVNAAAPGRTEQAAGRHIENEHSVVEEPGAISREQPRDWCFHTAVGNEYASDSRTVWNGSSSVRIGADDVSKLATPTGMSTLWQAIDAIPYRGMRVEVTAHARTNAIGAFMLFLDSRTKDELPNVAYVTVPLVIAQFPVSQGWTRSTVTADVGSDADFLFYGVSYMGGAPLWVDDIRVTSVERQGIVPHTQVNVHTFFPFAVGSLLREPTNVDFEVTEIAVSNSSCERIRGR